MLKENQILRARGTKHAGSQHAKLLKRYNETVHLKFGQDLMAQSAVLTSINSRSVERLHHRTPAVHMAMKFAPGKPSPQDS